MVAHKRERKPKAIYEEMFDDLPRRRVPLDTLTEEEKNCPVCGTHIVPIGTESVRAEIVFYPVYMERMDYMTTAYEYPVCKEPLELQFVKDESGAPLVPHSYVFTAPKAYVIYGKFINALPYYWQEKDFENQFGVTIGLGTMALWIIYCTENYFLPIIDYFYRLLTARKFVSADETSVQVLKEMDRQP